LSAQQAPNGSSLLGFALGGLVVAEAVPWGQRRNLTVTSADGLPAFTWNCAVPTSPDFAVAVRVTSITSLPVALTTSILTVKLQMKIWAPAGTWQVPRSRLATVIPTTPRGAGGVGVGDVEGDALGRVVGDPTGATGSMGDGLGPGDGVAAAVGDSVACSGLGAGVSAAPIEPSGPARDASAGGVLNA